jgi:hypothetical protein
MCFYIFCRGFETDTLIMIFPMCVAKQRKNSSPTAGFRSDAHNILLLPSQIINQSNFLEESKHLKFDQNYKKYKRL